MLPVKLVRSLVLRETMNNPFLHNDEIEEDDDDEHDDDPHAHDADDEEDDNTQRRATSKDEKLKNKKKEKMMMNKRRTPLLLFTPTRELISDTFRLAAIARDIGMDFHPTPSLSHLIFSWPSPSSSSSSPSSSSLASSSLPSSTPSTSSPFSPSSSSPSSTSTSTSALQNDAVPLPFPSLSTPSASLSLLRYFVSLSKGLFKLVFFNFDPHSEIHPRFKLFNDWHYNYSDCSSPTLFLFSRVSAKRVGSMDDFSRELAGFGWTLFRTRQKPKSQSCSSSSLALDLVYLFRKKELNRVRVRVRAKGPGGGHEERECRVRELRLPALDFKSGVPLRILLYILLMTDDIFYLA